METESKIRRMFFVKGWKIKEIVRQTGIARNTIRRVVRASSAGRQYKRLVQAEPKLGGYKSTLVQWLEMDSTLPRKQRRSAMKYFTDLQALGYRGAYDSVQRFVKAHKAEVSKAAYIPLSFSPSEAYQFDWSEEVVELGGVTQKVQVAHVRLCYSRCFLVVAYTRQRLEMLFDAHNRAFEYFGGMTERGIYDNMKTAVSTIFVGKKREYNSRFLSMLDHYLVEPTACTPASGWEKGQVENQVDNVRDWLFKPRLKFANVEALNAHLISECQRLASIRKHPEQKHLTIAQVFEQEQSHLRPFIQPFDGFNEESVRVNSTCQVNYDRNRYSADCAYVNKVVTLKAYATRIQIESDGVIIGEHKREFGRDKSLFNPWHYLPLLERKPGALRNGKPFEDWQLPTPIEKVKIILLKRPGGDKECVAILLAMQTHGIESVAVACELALSEKTVSKDVILNTLHRLQMEPSTESIATPQTLRLKQEPAFNCEHYDALISEVCHA